MKKILFLLATSFPLFANAQFYSCKDSSGRTITSDRPIAECANRSVRELDKNGLVRREIPAPLTPEQKKQKQQEEEQRKANEAAMAEKQRQDMTLLMIYHKESDIEAARGRALQPVEEQMQRQRITLGVAEKSLRDAQAEAKQHQGKKEIPPGIARKVERSEQMVGTTKKMIAELNAHVEQINEKYNEMLARFRAIKIDN